MVKSRCPIPCWDTIGEMNLLLHYNVVMVFYGSFDFPYLCYFYKRYKNCEQTIILSLRKVFSFKTIVTHLLYLSLNFSTPFPFFNLCINSLPFFLLNIIKKYKHFCFAISLISPSLRILFNCLTLYFYWLSITWKPLCA